MKKLLLIACSKHKHRHLESGPARQIYTGTLFRFGLRYAEQIGADITILSAKYGLIKPDDVIDTYDQRMKGAYDGPWPEKPGFYVGGKDYFGKAPDHLKPLVEGAQCLADWTEGVRLLCENKGPVAFGERRMKVGGRTDFIYRRLLAGRVTKKELFAEMVEVFGDHPGMKITINCQLLQSRMGVERNCTVHKEGEHYWITPNA